jgi:hypothetical protein
MTQPWRWINQYLSGNRADLKDILRKKGGVYLIARPSQRDRVSVKDIVYIGLAGGNASADGTFEQRIRSHCGKLQRGGAEAGCPMSWATYHENEGGPDSLRRHALRLIVMPSQSTEEKLNIQRLEDFMLLIWQAICERNNPVMPALNSRRPDIAAISALFEGSIEDNDTPAPLAPDLPITALRATDATGMDRLSIDPIEVLWPNDDDSLEQAEKLEQFRRFFLARDQENIWNSLKTSATSRGLSLKVVGMKSLMTRDRPGELRVSTMWPVTQRARQVHAILVPDLSGRDTRVDLRLPVEQLPDLLAALAKPYTRGSIRSTLRLPNERLPEVVALFPPASGKPTLTADGGHG